MVGTTGFEPATSRNQKGRSFVAPMTPYVCKRLPSARVNRRAKTAHALRCNLEKHLRMTLGYLQQLLRCARRLATSLFPLLQGTLGNPKGGGKLRLGQTALLPHANDMGLGFNFRTPAPASLDLTYPIQDLLPHVTLSLELSQRLASKLLTHF